MKIFNLLFSGLSNSKVQVGVELPLTKEAPLWLNRNDGYLSISLLFFLFLSSFIPFPLFPFLCFFFFFFFWCVFYDACEKGHHRGVELSSIHHESIGN